MLLVGLLALSTSVFVCCGPRVLNWTAIQDCRQQQLSAPADSRSFLLYSQHSRLPKLAEFTETVDSLAGCHQDSGPEQERQLFLQLRGGDQLSRRRDAWGYFLPQWSAWKRVQGVHAYHPPPGIHGSVPRPLGPHDLP